MGLGAARLLMMMGKRSLDREGINIMDEQGNYLVINLINRSV